MLALERKRSERSRKPFLLMLVDLGERLPSASNGKVSNEIVSALSLATRVTDVIGWYKDDTVIGILFTEIVVEDRSTIMGTMMTRISTMLGKALSPEQLNQVSISLHLFPEEWDFDIRHRPSNPTLYPDLLRLKNRRKHSFAVKRLMDIVGSSIALIFFAPVFFVVGLVIKTSSKGPVLFRQQRIGQHGEPFTFLKFRTMHVNNDPALHQEYVRKLIAGQAEPAPSNGNGHGVYKIKSDPRVTRFGAFLRRTSLDELPQLINVLQGEMSLVGPRPPIKYEVDHYDIWHRSRLLEAKPGITGLWQVNGRSRVKFDDMVRLDIRYARTWSIGLDIKILLQTPHAVLLGEGAY
ncbi:MAG: sugar transferase [Candidatus Sulfotelmatobacter sp.]|jgi:exopolysaccharide biosynthesis polyprenyl glycosylphosphotransferase